MNNPTGKGADGSMWLRRANGQKLISAQTAMEMVRMVVKDQHGQLEVDRNEPLSCIDDGDAWIVNGNESPEFNAKNPPKPTWSGPLRMCISKIDGQILSYVFTFDWENIPTGGSQHDAN